MEEKPATSFQIDAEGRVVQIQGGEGSGSEPNNADSQASDDEVSTPTEEWYKQTEK